MNKVKYQIFVSSTYDDLKEERDQVIKAILEMGHIPVGMEMFSAADEEQWKIITRQIDDSDYYIVIVANRYGSMVDGISYTEKEYDYAISNGIPTLGFVLDSKAAWPSDRLETDKKARSKLEAFKKKVKLKPVNFWASKEDLNGKCAIALGKTFNTQPRPGWVRSPDSIGPEVASELSRLSSQNAKLLEENTELRKSADPSDLLQGNDELMLSFKVSNRDTFENKRWEKVVEIKITWDEIFVIVADTIIDHPWEYNVRIDINNTYYRRVVEQLLSDPKRDIPDYVKNLTVALERKDFKAIRIQLIALRLVSVNPVHNEHETVNNWTLTELGKQQFAFILAQRRS